MDNFPTHSCAPTSLAELVEMQARKNPLGIAFRFEDDTGVSTEWSYAEMAARSQTLGAWLAKRVPIGERRCLTAPAPD